MARRHEETDTLNIRLPASLSEKLDALVSQRQAENRHAPVSRSSVARELIAKGLEGAG